MEELIGVSACALGDMASRPNFGLYELDFVFSTLVVGSIVNFIVMYLLFPVVVSSALLSYMFEPDAYSPLARLGTFGTKGATFGAVGFAVRARWHNVLSWFDRVAAAWAPPSVEILGTRWRWGDGQACSISLCSSYEDGDGGGGVSGGGGGGEGGDDRRQRRWWE